MSQPFFIALEGKDEIEVAPGCHVKFVHGERMTHGYWRLEPGAEIPEHAHPHEQVSMQIRGEFDLTIAGQAHRQVPGDVAVIPSNAIHFGKALTECEVIDVFAPVREDYRELG